MSLTLLSAGAAKGLAADILPDFENANGVTVQGLFSAVGAIQQKFIDGEPCDVLILTARQLQLLAEAGRVLPQSVNAIGNVRTAVAVPAGHPRPDVSSGAALGETLIKATAIYIPDPYQSTAGIHVMSVLRSLGIASSVEKWIKAFPNGETAMRALSEEAIAGAIGITQTTEIKYTPGIVLVGPLPPGHELVTTYSVAVNTSTTHLPSAMKLAATLTGESSAAARIRSGFEVP
jgi:molybdate transport system substrate-binding protein